MPLRITEPCARGALGLRSDQRQTKKPLKGDIDKQRRNYTKCKFCIIEGIASDRAALLFESSHLRPSSCWIRLTAVMYAGRWYRKSRPYNRISSRMEHRYAHGRGFHRLVLIGQVVSCAAHREMPFRLPLYLCSCLWLAGDDSDGLET